MDNLRKFATTSDYNAALLNLPAVSLVTESNTVYFDKADSMPEFSGLTVYYNVTEPNVEVKLFNGGGGSSDEGDSDSSGGGGSLPATMMVDDGYENPVNTWRFATAGIHTVKYTFTDPSTIDVNFNFNNNIVAVEIGNGIQIIDDVNDGIFGHCYNMELLLIGSGITSIAYNTFGYNQKLNRITIFATTPPTLGESAFDYTNDCNIYTPASSVNTYKTASGWSTYASRIQAIPE